MAAPVAGTTFKLGVTWTGTTAKGFADGSLTATGTYDGGLSDSGTVYIASDAGSNDDTASCKNVKIYRKALSQAAMIVATT